MERPKLEHGGTEYLCLVVADLPSEVGRLFAEMPADGQAAFWDAVAAASKRYEKPASFQWAAMSEAMTDDARCLVCDMHDAVRNADF